MHKHEWKPVPNAMAQYSCECGASGYRAVMGKFRGEIVEHKSPKKFIERTVGFDAGTVYYAPASADSQVVGSVGRRKGHHNPG